MLLMHSTLAEIATAEHHQVLVGRTVLSEPDIVEAILGGRQPAKLQVKELLRRFPVGWRKQRAECLIQTNGLRPPRPRRMISE